MPLVHHELCFGCGRANMFGLLAELQETGPGTIEGRCFIKQDHQGAQPGYAHDGVIAAALAEAMAFALGPGARTRELKIEVNAAVPVGAFLAVQAQAQGSAARATASIDGATVAHATGRFDG